MPEQDDEQLKAEYEALQQEATEVYQDLQSTLLIDDYVLLQSVSYLWILWADFHLYITTPFIAPIRPPLAIAPDLNPHTKRYEHVYTIYDHGYYFSTSRGDDLVKGIRTMGKFYNTVEKMIKLLIERLRGSGIPPEQEVQVAFHGLELAKRKAFESILNLQENVVVTNFEPGPWGEKFMANVKRLADKGFGVPKTSPRSII